MEIQDYLTILWRRKWVILITFLVTEAVVVFFTLRTTPIFSASTTLRVATSTTGSVDYTDYMYSDRLMNTYAKMATTKPVLDELKQRLGITDLPDIGVEVIPQTELMDIQVVHWDPILAAKIANTLADILVSKNIELYTGGGKSSLEILDEQLKGMAGELDQARKEYTALAAKNPDDAIAIQAAKQSLDTKQQIYDSILNEYEQARVNAAIREKSISIVEPAVPPASPFKPNVMMNIALGLFVGLLGGLGLVFLFENLDTTLYTTEQIEKLAKLPLLGTIPTMGDREHRISMHGNTPYSDAFRRLRGNILTLLKDTPCNTILVTSSEPEEGKSTLVTNLAYAMAQAGRKVAVVDGDLRRPTLHKTFKIPNELGLSNVLSQKNGLEEVLQDDSFPGLAIVTSGPLPANPVDLLDSDETARLIGRLREEYDLVLIDSPAVRCVSDAIALIPSIDNVILVVSRSYSRREDLQSTCKQLADANAHTLGIVINRAGQNHDYYYAKSKGLRSSIAAVVSRMNKR